MLFRNIDPQHYEQKIRNLESENEELRAEVRVVVVVNDSDR